MNPLLVDSCKKVEKQNSSTCYSKTQEFPPQHSRSTVIVAKNHSSVQNVKTPEHVLQIDIPVDYSLSGCTKENLVQKYEEIFDRVLLNPEGEYMRKLFEVDKSVLEQARNKEKMVFPCDYIATYKTISDSIGIQFLRMFLPNCSTNSLQKISSSTSKTLLGLMAGLNQCFCNGSMLDQIENFFPCRLF